MAHLKISNPYMNIIKETISDLKFLWAWIGAGIGNANLLFIDPTPLTHWAGASSAIGGFIITAITLHLKILELLEKRKENNKRHEF